MWKRLAKKLEIREPRGKPFRGTGDSELLDFEIKHDIRFPASYKAFATEIGAGLFCNYYSISTPDFGLDELWEIRGLDLFKQIYKDAEFIDRIIPFADTIAGDVIAWDPSELISSRGREYRVYVLPRHMSRIVPLCDDFKTFVNSVVFGHGFMVALSGKPDPDWRIEFKMQKSRPNRRATRYKLA